MLKCALLECWLDNQEGPKDQQINGEVNNEDTAPTREANAAWPIECISAVVASNGHY